MIVAKEIITLCEEWSKSTAIGGDQVDIYENPGSSDIKKLFKVVRNFEKEVRFIANAKTQIVYVWGAMLATHSDLLPILNLGSYVDLFKKPWLLLGYGNIENGKIVLSHRHDAIEGLLCYSDYKARAKFGGSVGIEKAWLTSVFEYKWSFLENYISGLGKYMDREKAKFFDWIKTQ